VSSERARALHPAKGARAENGESDDCLVGPILTTQYNEQRAAFPHPAQVRAEAGLQFTGADDAAFHVVIVPTSQDLVT
jgi:hypothetical protein